MICVILTMSGYFIGKASTGKLDDSVSEISSSSYATEHVSVSADLNDEPDYPFVLYETFLTSSSSSVIDKLNNNPIDKKYYEEYSTAENPQIEQDILLEWNNAYADELKSAKAELEKILQSKTSVGDSISNNDVLNALDEYYTNCLSNADCVGQLAYSFEEFHLGHGTGHIYDVLLNTLEANRTNTLRIVECIYLSGNDYQWKTDE